MVTQKGYGIQAVQTFATPKDREETLAGVLLDKAYDTPLFSPKELKKDFTETDARKIFAGLFSKEPASAEKDAVTNFGPGLELTVKSHPTEFKPDHSQALAKFHEALNDDRSLRVLHDAERFVNNSLDLPTTDEQRCQWIDVLFQACRAIEDNEADALPALRGFDKTEAYSVIPRLFQSILRDRVTEDAYSRAEKQARAASQRVAKQAEQEQQAKAKGRPDSNQTILDFGG